MKTYERFLKYAAFETPSDADSGTSPSSQCQFTLASALVAEMKAIGITDACVDEKCYVYGHIPATRGLEKKDAIGFIAHMDTVSDFCTHQAKPVMHPDYSGAAVALGESGRILSPDMFGHLPVLKGQTLITTDGTTILGADDKAGIAEIITAAEYILKNNIPHGPLCIAFTPDEEIGEGADHFDVAKFGAKYAYTVDGDTEGEIQYENFNAGSARVCFNGVNVHPGSSKNTMVNAALVAMAFNQMLPSLDTPRHTENYEGFYHLTSMQGDVAHAELSYIIRDHHGDYYQMRKETMQHITALLNEKWGEGTVTLELKDQYRNMSEVIKSCPQLISNAKLACEKACVAPVIEPIRGGTDGARLSFMGLPCPNLGTGGHAFHGPYEHITCEAMEKVTNIIVEIIKIFAE